MDNETAPDKDFGKIMTKLRADPNNNESPSAGYFSDERKTDYIRFVCSRDIREYLYETDYRISPLEAFFLIDYCTRLTFAEKIKALNELYSECDDSPVCLYDYKNIKSFKQLLKTVISGRLKSYEDFRLSTENRTIYRLTFRQKVWNSLNSYHYLEYGYYESLDDALSSFDYDDFDYLRIEKIKPGKPDPRSSPVTATAYFNKNRELLEIDDNCNDYPCYQDICIDLPVPFSKGDILCFTDSYRNESASDNFIYDSCSVHGGKISPYSDFSDNSLGFYSISSGYPFYDTFFNLFNYEYSRVPLQGDEQKLKPFSLFLKGQCQIDETLNWMTYLDDRIKKDRLRALTEQYIPEVIEAAAADIER